MVIDEAPVYRLVIIYIEKAKKKSLEKEKMDIK